MELQELVARARLLLIGAHKRLVVFNLINGKRSAKEIARMTRRSLSAALQDLQKMKDLELVSPRTDSKGVALKKDGSTIYEKVPLLKHLPASYFVDPSRLPQAKKDQVRKKFRGGSVSAANSIPSEQQILDICKNGEDQQYEFKQAGVEITKLIREVCAFANTKTGGVIFYGVDDNGTISGSDKRRQAFDQQIQNSVRSNITPSLTLKLVEKDVLGYKIILVLTPPWNKKDVYQMDGKVLIRKGTNVFSAKSDELRKLHDGQYVI